ncbi:uncharacterized protein Z519_08010 [Cladophialophora bantiana CBS 173.52]|uniref:Peptidase S33 tripeptidyl aminopeptidase-like C-terminal domain-containing protein n=1 Tax=Cladophialophora bantiana (strain ATCC 10958 / CBS 173.52 / CDC B-1940 / NIH 8579) TaxID=1442370 RepID=A0A0D2EM82_CLAB1|nr:uncharacterized protein Z519_08010 [Cladophialophora bantiana CBS 173.52]KIW91116.1 hypothetical protein Z519_08010 [Cladophialophora bantiana CBS 173.52]
MVYGSFEYGLLIKCHLVSGLDVEQQLGRVDQSIEFATQCISSPSRRWSSPVVNREKPLNVTGVSTHILVVNALFDPETLYEMAVKLWTEIEDSVLLTRRGDGHTSYSLHGDTQRAIDNYLVDLTLPGVGTVYDT